MRGDCNLSFEALPTSGGRFMGFRLNNAQGLVPSPFVLVCNLSNYPAQSSSVDPFGVRSVIKLEAVFSDVETMETTPISAWAWYADTEYTPFIPIIGKQALLFNSPFYPFGVEFEAGCYPFDFTFGKLGFFAKFNLSLPSGKSGITTTYGQLLTTGLGLRYQFPRFFVSQTNPFLFCPEFGLVGGYTFLTNQAAMDGEGGSGRINKMSYMPWAGFEFTVQFLAWRMLYMTAGVGCDVMFPKDLSQLVVLAMAKLCLGLRF
jgi:hypothetical protein